MGPVSSVLMSAPATAVRVADASAEGHRTKGLSQTVSFEVCNGFANQRLSLVYGLVIAKKLGRAAVLPTMILDGTQLTERDKLASDDRTSTTLFESFYDAEVLDAALAPHGVHVLTQREFALNFDGLDTGTAAINLGGARPINDVTRHFASYRDVQHLVLSCPLFKLAPNVIMAEHKFIWTVMAALRPAPALETHVKRAMSAVEGRPFNFLHIRLEKDWQAHCARCVGGGRMQCMHAAALRRGVHGTHMQGS